MIVPGSANFLLAGSSDPLDELGRIERSLRFRSSAAPILTRTPASTGNRQTWTANFWVKRGALNGTAQVLFAGGNWGSGTGSGYATGLIFNFANQLTWYWADSTVSKASSTAVYRDTGAHLNIHIKVNAAVASVFVNGVLALSYTGSGDGSINANLIQSIGAEPAGTISMDGYMSHFAFVADQALDPTSFGQFHPLTGQWRPKARGGIKAVVDAGGANSFFLPFDNPTNLTTLCTDASSKGNNWTSSNISLTAGSTYDSMRDTPTNNFPVINPIALTASGSTTTLTEGNLKAFHGNSSFGNAARASQQMTEGKWYAEAYFGAETGVNANDIGIIAVNQRLNINYATSAGNCYVGTEPNGYGFVRSSNFVGKRNNGVSTAYGTASLSGSPFTVSILFDADARTLSYWVDGVDQGIAFSSIPAGGYEFASSAAGASWSWNFGQRPFSYNPPAGYKSLCTKNLSFPLFADTKQYFDINLHSGTGVTQSISSLKFSPGLVWIKERGQISTHAWFDTVRGVLKGLGSDATAVETTDTDSLTSFNANGYTLGANSTGYSVNVSGRTYVGWSWKAGSSTVSNTSGSITSQVSANPAAGFSVVTYTGTGAIATVGHGLASAPKMVIVKPRVATTTDDNWNVGHSNLLNGFQTYLLLNSTQAQVTATNRWNNTAPNNTVFTIGSLLSDSAKTYVAYCFSEVPGYSSFGGYTGNGAADGPFINCGFRPRWILIKRTDAIVDWYIYDTLRGTYNTPIPELYPNASAAEGPGTGREIDIVSNGFKLRNTDTGHNVSAGTYIYAAFAEYPFRYANAR